MNIKLATSEKISFTETVEINVMKNRSIGENLNEILHNILFDLSTLHFGYSFNKLYSKLFQTSLEKIEKYLVLTEILLQYTTNLIYLKGYLFEKKIQWFVSPDKNRFFYS